MFKNRNLKLKVKLDNPIVPISKHIKILLISFIIIYIFLVGILNFNNVDQNQIYIFVNFAIYIILLFLPIIIFKWGWFHPLVFKAVWTFIITILPATFLYINGLNFHSAIPNFDSYQLNYLVAYNLLLKTLALLSTYFGYFVCFKIKLKKITVKFKKPSHLVFKLVIILLVSISSFFILMKTMGGINELLLQHGLPNTERVQSKVGGYHWNFLVSLMIPALYVVLSLKIEVIKKFWFWSLTIFSLFMIFAVNGSRSGVIMPLIIYYMIISFKKNKINYKAIIVIILIGIVLLGFLGNFRTASRDMNSLNSFDFIKNSLNSLGSGINTLTDYSSQKHGIYPILAKVPKDTNLLYGKSYLSMVLSPIPGALLPEGINKPKAVGRLTSKYFYGNPNSGVPPGAVGEAYWNFHLFGVIIIFFIWGFFLRFLLVYIKSNRHNRGNDLIYLITIFMLSPTSIAYIDWLQMIVSIIIFLFLFSGFPKIKIY